MSTKLERLGIKRQPGHLYYIQHGDILEKAPGEQAFRLCFLGVDVPDGYLAFVDRDGDVSVTPMSRGGRKKAKRKAAANRAAFRRGLGGSI